MLCCSHMVQAVVSDSPFRTGPEVLVYVAKGVRSGQPPGKSSLPSFTKPFRCFDGEWKKSCIIWPFIYLRHENFFQGTTITTKIKSQERR